LGEQQKKKITRFRSGSIWELESPPFHVFTVSLGNPHGDMRPNCSVSQSGHGRRAGRLGISRKIVGNLTRDMGSIASGKSFVEEENGVVGLCASGEGPDTDDSGPLR